MGEQAFRFHFSLLSPLRTVLKYSWFSCELVELLMLHLDPAGIYNGINNDLRFKETLKKIRADNQAVLARITEEMPEMLNPGSPL